MKRILMTVLLVTLVAGAAFAGSNPFGVRGGLTFEPDQFYVGGQMFVTEFSEDFWLVPHVDAAFGDDMTFIYIWGSALYSLTTTDLGGFTPYVGGGAGLTYYKYDLPAGFSGLGIDDSGTEFGISGIAGLKKKLDAKKELFFEFELGLSDYTADIKLGAGLNFF
jgi:opacity protein-like surface antigen